MGLVVTCVSACVYDVAQTYSTCAVVLNGLNIFTNFNFGEVAFDQYGPLFISALLVVFEFNIFFLQL